MSFGTHRVKVRGRNLDGEEREMVIPVGGNCKGWDVMETAMEEFVDRLILTIGAEWMDDEQEEEAFFEEDEERLEELFLWRKEKKLKDGIISVEILSFEPEE